MHQGGYVSATNILESHEVDVTNGTPQWHADAPYTLHVAAGLQSRTAGDIVAMRGSLPFAIARTGSIDLRCHSRACGRAGGTAHRR